MSAQGGWRRPPVRLATVEADVPGEQQAIDFGSAEEWRVLVMHERRPLRRVDLPDPGRTTGDGMVEAVVLAACDDERRRLRLAEDLRRRLGAPERRYPSRSVSVIACTRGRPECVSALLEALRGLDPAPYEVVVVDNAPPPGGDCRELAKAAGAVYVRQDTPGLNNARSAGVAAARGELLAFTDDDCVPPTRWLAALPELFDDRSVAVVTGPTLPAVLDTPSRVRFEEVATFSRGFRQLRFDCMSLSPPEAVRVGAGANMVFRRSHLDELGQVFVPELDTGTPTRSGGDHYAFYRVLAAGRRIVYDPRVFTYHMHRADPRSLHETVYGYGVGLSAVATKVLLEEGELAALKIWRWMGREYVRSVLLALAGRLDPVAVRMRWDYVRGALEGPSALRASQRRSERSTDAHARPRAPTRAERPVSPPPAGTSPEVSVVVTTHRPPDVVGRCLEALAAQEGSSPRFEVVLVDDSVDGAARSLSSPGDLSLTRLATKGAGLATARNAGARAARAGVLLFLDDDLVPAPDLVARHAARHRAAEPPCVVVGYSPPRPTRRTLAAISASLWWEDHFRERSDAAGGTFVDVLARNMSVRRQAFEEIGPFDLRLGSFRREHWEWGMRALCSGAEVAYEPDAVALHRFSLDTRERLSAARSEGHGDALLLERYPEVLPSLPVAFDPPPDTLPGRLLLVLLRQERVREWAVPFLDLLERLKARKAWAGWFRLAVHAAYEQGFREGGGRRHADPNAAPVAALELESRDKLPPPKGAAPVLAITARGAGVSNEPPQAGRWSGALAERIAAHVPAPHLKRIDGPRRATGGSSLGDVTVVLPGAGERQAATEQSEAEVLVLASGDGRRWEAIDDAIRSAGRPLIALPLAGARPRPGWPAEAIVAFEGERVAAVIGRGLEPGDGDRPLTLHAGRGHRAPYSVVGVRPDYVVVRHAAYIALGGFDPRLGRFGEEAPVLDLLERTLRGGWLVGQRDTAALEAPARSAGGGLRTDWVLSRTRGTLIARDAGQRGLLWFARWGAVSVAANLWRAGRPTRPARRRALVCAVALALGSAQWGAVALRRGGEGRE